KRSRDNAQSYYQHGMYGFASREKEQKERFYFLKDRVIKRLEHEGQLEVLGRWDDGPKANMFLVRFGDFTFHCSLSGNYPVCHVDHDKVTIDAKPLSKGYRLKDCERTLDDFCNN